MHDYTPSVEEIRIAEELSLLPPSENHSIFGDNDQLGVVIYSSGSNDAIASTNSAFSTATWAVSSAVSKARAIAWSPIGKAESLLKSLTLVDINGHMAEMGCVCTKATSLIVRLC
jgi:hypothetical protein